MFRLTRLNEIQYVETEAQRDKLIEDGFVLDELASDVLQEDSKEDVLQEDSKEDVLQEDSEETDEVSRRGKRSKGGA